MLLVHRIMYLENSYLTFLLLLVSICLGAAVGEAIYSLVWRSSRDEFWGSGSRCPECGHVLERRELIPLVSWIRQRGRCTHCGRPISLSYPTTELLGGMAFASVILRFGPSLQALEVLALVSVLLAVSLSALLDYRIPNVCIFAGVLVRALYVALMVLLGRDTVQLVLTTIVGGLALSLPMLLALLLSNVLMRRDPIGMGTIKLLFLVGCCLGWQQGLLAVAISAFIGGVILLASPAKLVEVEVEGGATDGVGPNSSGSEAHFGLEEDIAEPMRMIPFAPSLSIGCWLMLLVGIAPALWSSPIF